MKPGLAKLEYYKGPVIKTGSANRYDKTRISSDFASDRIGKPLGKLTKHVTHQIVPPGAHRKVLPRPGHPMTKKKALKKTGENEEMFNVKYTSYEYDSKISELEKKSTDALKRLEAHIRSREIELKEKQDVELTQIKQSLLDVMKEKENGFYQRRQEIQAQEARLEELIEKQRRDHSEMQQQAQNEYIRRKNEIENLEISSKDTKTLSLSRLHGLRRR